MIRKPSADWQRFDEGATVRTVRTAAAVAQSGARVAQSGVHVMRGVICYAFAALWGFAAIMSGLGLGLPSFIGIGAMAYGMFWLGNRAFAKARGG
jgi:hypothetical protein